MSAPVRRSGWADVMRLIGIYWILVGHFSGYAGRFYPFVFSFHVPLFFFSSGLFASRRASRGWKSFVGQKALRLLVPYLFYGTVCTVLQLIWLDGQFTDLIGYGLQLLRGVRDQINCGQALWFLPCLFVQSLLYYGICKAVPGRTLRFGICLAAGMGMRLLVAAPFLPWGLDNAVRYLPYYALGDWIMPFLQQAENKTLSRTQQVVAAVVVLAGLGVSAATYWFGPETLLYPLVAVPALYLTVGVYLYAVMMIALVAAASFALQRVPALCRLGRYTITVCGLESILRITVDAVFRLLGLQMDYTNPYCVLLLCAALVWLGCTIGSWLERYYPVLGGYPVLKNQEV